MKKLEIVIDGNSFVDCRNNKVYLKSIIDFANAVGMNYKINITNRELFDESKLDFYCKNDINILSDSIRKVLLDNIKGRDKEHILVVLSMSNYALDVNKNNNSHYFYMDSFLTDTISKRVLELSEPLFMIDLKYKGVNLLNIDDSAIDNIL